MNLCAKIETQNSKFNICFYTMAAETMIPARYFIVEVQTE